MQFKPNISHSEYTVSPIPTVLLCFHKFPIILILFLTFASVYQFPTKQIRDRYFSAKWERDEVPTWWLSEWIVSSLMSLLATISRSSNHGKLKLHTQQQQNVTANNDLCHTQNPQWTFLVYSSDSACQQQKKALHCETICSLWQFDGGISMVQRPGKCFWNNADYDFVAILATSSSHTARPVGSTSSIEFPISVI